MDRTKQKTKALMQYICSRVPPERTGIVKVHKIMWFSETETMRKTGQALTGQTYIRLRFGPVALNAPAMREELIREGKLEEMPSESMQGGLTRRIFVAESPPVDMEQLFTQEQISIIDEQIERLQHATGMDTSDMSHDSIWATLEDGDAMPLHLYKWQPVYTDEQTAALEERVRDQAGMDYGPSQ
jgi:hypothetical protein